MIYVDANNDGVVTEDDIWAPDGLNSTSAGNRPTDYYFYGGSKNETIAGDTSIVMEGGRVTSIFGGSRNGTVTGSTSVTISGGTITASVYGAGADASSKVDGDTSVTVTGGTMNWVYGGGYDGTVTGDTSVVASGGKVNNFICGGSSGASGGTTGDIGGSASVTFSGSAETLGISGGSYYSGKIGKNVTVTVTGGKISDKYVPYDGIIFGAGYEGGVGGNVTIQMSGGTVVNNIYGTSYRSSAAVGGNVQIEITGGTVEDFVYAKGAANVTGTVSLTVGGAACIGQEGKGIQINGTSYPTNGIVNFKVSPDLSETASVYVCLPSDFKVDNDPIIATEGIQSDIQKLTLTGSVPSGKSLYLDGTNIRLGNPHTHAWATAWSSDNTHHWHDCTAADCTITDNSKKDGYAEHTYDQQVKTDAYKANDADCTTPAAYYYSCVCGKAGTETFTDGVENGHTWGGWMSNGDDTHSRTCSVCSEKETENCSGGTATCTVKATCDTCKGAYGAVAPDNHTGTPAWEQTETTHKGVYACCGAEASAEEAHQWENGVCTVCQYPCAHQGGEATCMSQAVCERCGSLYGAVDPDHHKAESAWTWENDSHYHKCENGCGTHLDEAVCTGGTADCVSKAECAVCDHKYGGLDSSSHASLVKTDAQAPTCTNNGKEAYYACENCGKYFADAAGQSEIQDLAGYGIFPAIGHTLIETEEKAATCTEEGWEAYWTCETCGKLFSDEAGTTEISAPVTIAKLAHSYGAEWKSDDTNHWQECADCGEKTEAAAHAYGDWTVTKEATTTEAGSREKACSVCGYKVTEVIPATGTATDSTEPTEPETPSAPDESTDAPQTGDTSNIALVFVLLLLSGAGVTGMVGYNRKKA